MKHQFRYPLFKIRLHLSQQKCPLNYLLRPLFVTTRFWVLCFHIGSLSLSCIRGTEHLESNLVRRFPIQLPLLYWKLFIRRDRETRAFERFESHPIKSLRGRLYRNKMYITNYTFVVWCISIPSGNLYTLLSSIYRSFQIFWLKGFSIEGFTSFD